MNWFVIISLFLSLQVKAQSTAEIIDFLTSPGVPSPVACSSFEDPSLACAKLLCGDAKEIPFVEPVDMFSATPAPRLLVSDLEHRRIRSLLEAVRDRELSLIRELKSGNALEKLQSIYADMNAVQWSSLASSVYGPMFTRRVDTTKPLSERLSFNIEASSISPETRAGLDSYLQEISSKLTSDELSAAADGLYTASEIPSVLSRAWKRLSELNPQSVQLQHLESRIQGLSQLSPFEVSSLVYELKALRNDPPQVLCQNPECKNGIRQARGLDFLRSWATQRETQISSSNYLSSALESCVSQQVQNIHDLALINQFREGIPELMDQFVDSGMEGFSEESRTAFRRYLKNEIELDFGVIPPLDQRISESERRVLSISGSETSRLGVQSIIQSGQWDPIFQVQVCQLQNQNVSDNFGGQFALPGEKHRISVSKFSYTHPTYGRGIVTHEIGHALSHFVKQGRISLHSAEVYRAARSCVSRNYLPDEPSRNLLFSDDRMPSEEDTADYFAFKALRSGPLFSCSTLQRDTSGEYSGLSLGVQQNMSGGAHSTPLLRIIREALSRGQILPASCQTVMNQSLIKFSFSRCI